MNLFAPGTFDIALWQYQDPYTPSRCNTDAADFPKKAIRALIFIDVDILDPQVSISIQRRLIHDEAIVGGYTEEDEKKLTGSANALPGSTARRMDARD